MKKVKGKKIAPDSPYWSTPLPMRKIGIEPKQYEFECECGHTWIDSQNNSCPMCSNEVGITAVPYETKPPNKFGKRGG